MFFFEKKLSGRPVFLLVLAVFFNKAYAGLDWYSGHGISHENFKFNVEKYLNNLLFPEARIKQSIAIPGILSSPTNSGNSDNSQSGSSTSKRSGNTPHVAPPTAIKPRADSSASFRKRSNQGDDDDNNRDYNRRRQWEDEARRMQQTDQREEGNEEQDDDDDLDENNQPVVVKSKIKSTAESLPDANSDTEPFRELDTILEVEEVSELEARLQTLSLVEPLELQASYLFELLVDIHTMLPGSEDTIFSDLELHIFGNPDNYEQILSIATLYGISVPFPLLSKLLAQADGAFEGAISGASNMNDNPFHKVLRMMIRALGQINPDIFYKNCLSTIAISLWNEVNAHYQNYIMSEAADDFAVFQRYTRNVAYLLASNFDLLFEDSQVIMNFFADHKLDFYNGGKVWGNAQHCGTKLFQNLFNVGLYYVPGDNNMLDRFILGLLQSRDIPVADVIKVLFIVLITMTQDDFATDDVIDDHLEAATSETSSPLTTPTAQPGASAPVTLRKLLKKKLTPKQNPFKILGQRMKERWASTKEDFPQIRQPIAGNSILPSQRLGLSQEYQAPWMFNSQHLSELANREAIEFYSLTRQFLLRAEISDEDILYRNILSFIYGNQLGALLDNGIMEPMLGDQSRLLVVICAYIQRYPNKTVQDLIQELRQHFH